MSKRMFKCLHSYGFLLIKSICNLLSSIEAKPQFTFAQSIAEDRFFFLLRVCVEGDVEGMFGLIKIVFESIISTCLDF